jgi:hypothetical protein
MKVTNAPLVDTVQFTAMDGTIQTGVHIATVESDSSLSEYIVVYDPAEDKVMAFQKRYINPEDPADFDIVGINDQHLLNEIAYFCNKEGLFDHLPAKKAYEEDSNEE